MNLRTTWRAAVSLVALSLLALGAAQANGTGDRRVGAELTISIERTPTSDRLKGRISSGADTCSDNRKIRLILARIEQTPKGEVLATLRTNGKGRWTYRPKKNQNGVRFATPGYYRTKVGQTRRQTGGGEFICKSKKSPALFVG